MEAVDQLIGLLQFFLDWESEIVDVILTHKSFGTRSKGWWQERIRQTEGYIKDIPDPNRHNGTLQIGYLPYFPSFGMWLIDPDQSHGQIHVEVYHHRTPAMNATFSLHAAKESYWYSFFRKQFDELWKLCEESGRVVDALPPAAV